MEIIINDKNEKNYNFKPKNKIIEIQQNLENIISRVKGNIPLARHKGISIENIDLPQEMLRAKLITEIDDEIEREESRFKLEEAKLNYDKSINGIVGSTIKGEINE